MWKPSPGGIGKAYPCGKHSPAEIRQGLPVWEGFSCGNKAGYTHVESLPLGGYPRGKHSLRKQGRVYPRGKASPLVLALSLCRNPLSPPNYSTTDIMSTARRTSIHRSLMLHRSWKNTLWSRPFSRTSLTPCRQKLTIATP